jgi:phosphatidate cytidylyltransferase
LEILFNEKFRPTMLLFWLALLAVAGCMIVTSFIIPFHPQLPQTESTNFYQFIFTVLLGFFLLSAMWSAIGKEPPPELFRKHSRLFWGVAYIGMLYPFVYAVGFDQRIVLLSKANSGGDLLLFLFGLLWVGDTCAMGFGKWLGRHKLAPAVSPNKTIEGFIGGVIGSLAIGVLMAFWKFKLLPIHHVLLISIGCSIFGQLGDLVESMWKRSLGIKDSSSIIPGHGGVLDRFDSLLFAAPFMYAYIRWILG